MLFKIVLSGLHLVEMCKCSITVEFSCAFWHLQCPAIFNCSRCFRCKNSVLLLKIASKNKTLAIKIFNEISSSLKQITQLKLVFEFLTQFINIRSFNCKFYWRQCRWLKWYFSRYKTDSFRKRLWVCRQDNIQASAIVVFVIIFRYHSFSKTKASSLLKIVYLAWLQTLGQTKEVESN